MHFLTEYSYIFIYVQRWRPHLDPDSNIYDSKAFVPTATGCDCAPQITLQRGKCSVLTEHTPGQIMIQHALSCVLKWDSNYHKYKHLISQTTEAVIECKRHVCVVK